jgi:hypothetical protein
MISPSDGSIRSRLCILNVKLRIWLWQRNATESSIIRKVTQSLDLSNCETSRSEKMIVVFSIIVRLVGDRLARVEWKLAQGFSRLAIDTKPLVGDAGKSGAPAWGEHVPILLSFDWSIFGQTLLGRG